MIVRALRDYVAERQQVSLLELASHFKLDPDIVRDICALLLRKGYLVKKTKTAECGGKCVKCHPHAIEIYATCMK